MRPSTSACAMACGSEGGGGSILTCVSSDEEDQGGMPCPVPKDVVCHIKPPVTARSAHFDFQIFDVNAIRAEPVGPADSAGSDVGAGAVRPSVGLDMVQSEPPDPAGSASSQFQHMAPVRPSVGMDMVQSEPPAPAGSASSQFQRTAPSNSSRMLPAAAAPSAETWAALRPNSRCTCCACSPSFTYFS